LRIEWGSGTETVEVASLPPRSCPACGGQRPFTLRLSYRCSYFLDPALSWVSRRSYAEVCDRCGRGSSVDPRMAERSLSTVPIPWQRRYGMALGGAAITAMTLVVVLIIRLSQMPSQR